ncbi:MAG: hypothetical protein K0U45_06515 [Alphaproteobacteria bacterium]|nr:hypothetical protein [Alphaproteobacteria bacterium]
MVYDVENLFTLRPERSNIAQARVTKPASATQSFVDFSQNIRPPINNAPANIVADKIAVPDITPPNSNVTNINVPKINVPNISANSPFNVDAAFTRLNNILASSNQNQLQQNYSGRGSILNVVV